MGSYTGKYSRAPFSVFNEAKNYAGLLMQEGIPSTDVDENDGTLIGLFERRRLIQLFGEYGSPNDGFDILESTVTTVNNFNVRGGGPTNTDPEVAGRWFMKGILCTLLTDVDYVNDLTAPYELSKKSLHPRVTRVSYVNPNTVIEDSAAEFVTSELVGRTINVGGADYAVVANTINSISVAGDQTGSINAGDHYILKLTTPSGSAREDGVYLNVYFDEYDDGDDPELVQDVGGQPVTAQLRLKAMHTLFVREDVPGVGSDLDDYVDSDGNQHYVFKLAKIDRPDGDADIETGDITNYSPNIGLENIGNETRAELKPVPTSPVSANIYISDGKWQSASALENLTWVGANVGPFAVVAAGAGWERYDVVTIDDGGNARITQGVEATTGNAVVPRFPKDGIAVAIVFIDEPATVLVSVGDIGDVRPFLVPDNNGLWIPVSPNLTLPAQLAGAQDGDHFFLLPGTHSLTSALGVSGVGAVVRGAGGYTGGSEISLDDVSATISLNGIRQCFERIHVCANSVHISNPSLTAAVDWITIRDCLFTDTSGGTRATTVELAGLYCTFVHNDLQLGYLDDGEAVLVSGSNCWVLFNRSRLGGTVGANTSCVRITDQYNTVLGNILDIDSTSSTAWCVFDAASNNQITGNDISPSTAAVSSFGIEVGGATVGTEIRGNNFHGATDCIRLGPSAENTLIIGNTATGSTSFVTIGGVTTTNTQIIGNHVATGSGTLIENSFNGAGDLVIRDNFLETSAGSAILIFGTPATYELFRITISGNRIKCAGNATYGAIEVSGADDIMNIQINDNHIYMSATGIDIIGIRLADDTAGAEIDSMIQDNQISCETDGGRTAYGIIVDGSYVSVTGNVARDGITSGSAIDLTAATSDYCVVLGNVIRGAVANAGGGNNDVVHNIVAV